MPTYDPIWDEPDQDDPSLAEQRANDRWNRDHRPTNYIVPFDRSDQCEVIEFTEGPVRCAEMYEQISLIHWRK